MLIGLALVVVLVAILGTGGVYLFAGGHGTRHLAATRPTATATDAPTATPLPTATPTPRPTPTPTPAPVLVTLYQNALTSPAPGWANGGNSNCKFEPDGYHVFNGAECFAPLAAQRDDNISVRVKQVHTGDVNAMFGVVFRASGSSNSEYMFGIWTTGEWLFGTWGGDRHYSGPTASPAIHRGLGASNTLAVHISGTHFEFFINGTDVGGADDSSFSSGYCGLMVEQNQYEEAVFTDITVTKWT